MGSREEHSAGAGGGVSKHVAFFPQHPTPPIPPTCSTRPGQPQPAAHQPGGALHLLLPQRLAHHRLQTGGGAVLASRRHHHPPVQLAGPLPLPPLQAASCLLRACYLLACAELYCVLMCHPLRPLVTHARRCNAASPTPAPCDRARCRRTLTAAYQQFCFPCFLTCCLLWLCLILTLASRFQHLCRSALPHFFSFVA